MQNIPGSESILYKKENNIVYITINRPEVKNCLNPDNNRLLREYWHEFAADPEAWVAVVTGTGDEAFCTGADLKAVKGGLSADDLSVPFGGITRGIEVFKPVIAAVNGLCLGGGLELMLCCDLRVAAEKAKFGFPEVRWGMIPAAGGTQRLPRNIPLACAMQIMLTGNPIDAAEAQRIGLINEVVSSALLMSTVNKLAELLISRGPLALRAAKEAMLKGMDKPLPEALEIEDLIAKINRSTDDYREGPRSFAEKRKPIFKGR